ncbi:hypothetical protein HNQ36_004657 [Afipia massiliensis]|uniref:Uncharacterized protein n=1 Tax=Afipia massiliensis TaxID=211460 RepID=A0A840N631_9BRAD|nr:hypothetical protein [Afipia massiliensis]MBB5054650.1 hypothetical protein [Afipia massiliensis]
MKLKISAPQVFGLETKIVSRDELHAKDGLIEASRLFQILRTDGKMIETENLHVALPRFDRVFLIYHPINNAASIEMQAAWRWMRCTKGAATPFALGGSFNY